ncbi:hypothetical protein [Bacteroidetes bacterium endosymbiont of Geopemphigus sp.]|uniref:hypothetical protein n=1 Tax=Bacteroidetes bacterium endosymbiont of Geopemphigus sp. TaxID=2047937 RepID=UPI002242D486|nr:hypothetical protein [Bacteroidetes bacterium endosymbiont of Geopemphigus sp.]
MIKGRNLDIRIRNYILINPKNWNKKNQRVRNIASVHQKDLINDTLEKLSAYLFERMNEDHIARRTIDSVWARKTLADFFGGSYEKDKAIFVTEWMEEYIEPPFLKTPYQAIKLP